MIATTPPPSTFQDQSAWAKPIPPENAERCTICGIFIFDSQAEAEASRIPYVITINQAIDELCIGCAGGDEGVHTLLTLVERIERGERIEQKEILMLEPNGLFLEMETGVMPPAAGPSGSGKSKYMPLEQAVLELSGRKSGSSEWARFKFADKKAATSASSWLLGRCKSAYREQGHDLNRRVVPNADGTAWLYVQRFKLEEA